MHSKRQRKSTRRPHNKLCGILFLTSCATTSAQQSTPGSDGSQSSAAVSAAAADTAHSVPAARLHESCSFNDPHALAAPIASVKDPRAECDRNSKVAHFTGKGTYSCQGLPFEITFPSLHAPVEQHWGKGWMSLQLGGAAGIVAVSFRPQPWALDRRHWAEADKFGPRLLQAVSGNAPTMQPVKDIQITGTDLARDADFVAGKLQLHGTSRTVLTRGWMINVLVGGQPGKQLHRSSADAQKFLGSLRILPPSPPVLHHFKSGVTLALPSESWFVGAMNRPGIVEETMYSVPASGDMLMVAEATAPKACDALTEADWLKATGKITPQQTDQKLRMVRTHWLERDSLKMVLVEAELRTTEAAQQNRPFQPAGAILACSGGQFYQLFVIAPRGGPRDRLAEIFRSLHIP